MGLEGRWELRNSNPKSFVPWEAAAGNRCRVGKKGDFTPNLSWALPGRRGSSWELIFGGKSGILGSVPLCPPWAGPGRGRAAADTRNRGRRPGATAPGRAGSRHWGEKREKRDWGGKKMRDLSPFGVKSGVLGQKLPVGMRNSCPHLLVPSMIVRRQSRNTSEKEPRSWQLWIEGKQRDWHNSRIFWEGFLGIWCCPKSAGIEGIWGEPSSPPPARVWRPGTAQTAGKWEKQQRTTLNHSPKKTSF